VAIAIAEAVGAANAQGLVHRDLKPENVMRTEGGSIKVLDFGLAREAAAVATGITPTITQAGALIGTPAYMAPEQIRGQPLDARTDVFAIGVLLYELASGVHPFGAGSGTGANASPGAAAGDVLARIVAEEPPPLDMRAMVPAAAAAIVARAIAKAPEGRFANGTALAEALRALPAPALTPLPAARPSGVDALGAVGAHDERVQERWWIVHQAGVALFFTAVLVPAWILWRDIEPKNLRLALRVALLFSVAAGVSVRLHLWFVARYRARALADERRVARPWVLLTNTSFIVALAIAAFALLETHPATASIFFGLAVVHTVLSVMIEPATNRAFTGTPPMPDPPA
jgi:hypothetical protein